MSHDFVSLFVFVCLRLLLCVIVIVFAVLLPPFAHSVFGLPSSPYAYYNCFILSSISSNHSIITALGVLQKPFHKMKRGPASGGGSTAMPKAKLKNELNVGRGASRGSLVVVVVGVVVVG